jgi:hypothetical protein
VWLKQVLKALNTMVPKAILEAWKQGERFLPHVQAVAEALPDRLGDQELRATWTKRSPWLTPLHSFLRTLCVRCVSSFQ